jgi:hypothetical protein
MRSGAEIVVRRATFLPARKSSDGEMAMKVSKEQ